jgi:hypothetical protein
VFSGDRASREAGVRSGAPRSHRPRALGHHVVVSWVPVPTVAHAPPQPTRPYILNDLTWKTVRDARYEVALLPWGATEAHNFHLPYSTDNVETERIASLAAGHASARGVRVVVLPVVPFGINTGQLDIPLCVNLNPSTQALVLRDVATALAGQGIPKSLHRQLVSGGGPEAVLFRPGRPCGRARDERHAPRGAGAGAALGGSRAWARAPVHDRSLARRVGLGATALAPGDGRHGHREPRGRDRG